MIDLNQFLTVGGLATFLLLLTQALKAYIPSAEARYIPFATLGLGILFGEVFAGATGHLSITQDWLSYGIGGLIAGFTAIGGYEATLDKMLNPKTPPPASFVITSSGVNAAAAPGVIVTSPPRD